MSEPVSPSAGDPAGQPAGDPAGTPPPSGTIPPPARPPTAPAEPASAAPPPADVAASAAPAKPAPARPAPAAPRAAATPGPAAASPDAAGTAPVAPATAGPLAAAEADLQTAATLLASWTKDSATPEPGRLDVSVAAPSLVPAIAALRAARWGRLSAITGLDLKMLPAEAKPARAPAAARATPPGAAGATPARLAAPARPAAPRPTPAAPAGEAPPAPATPARPAAPRPAPAPGAKAVPAAEARPAGAAATAAVRPAGAAARPAGAAARPTAAPGAAAAPPVPPTDDFEALYHVASFSSGAVLTLRVRLPRARPEVPSICGVIPYAGFYERELGELFGVTILDAPSHDPLILPDDWPAGVYPLRKDATLPKPPQDGHIEPEDYSDEHEPHADEA